MIDIEKVIAEADERVKALVRENNRNELDGMLHEANRAVNKCVFDHAWVVSVPAALVSIPFSVRYKTYAPLVFAGVTGSGFDYFRGILKCQDHRDRIKHIKLAIAIQDYQNGRIPSVPYSPPS